MMRRHLSRLRSAYTQGAYDMTAAELRAALVSLNWSHGDLARLIHRHKDTVWRWTRGKYGTPWAIAQWLSDLARYHEAHPPPPLLDHNGRERIKRQPRVPKLAEEEHRDAGLVTPDADHHAPDPSSRPVPDPEGIPSGWYRPPG